VTLSTLVFLALVAGTIALFSYNMRRLIASLKIGKAESRTDHPAQRLAGVLTVGFGQ
jgi:hypothetical protein